MFTHNSSSCHGNSSSPITISSMVMLELYPCGSLDKVKLHEMTYPAIHVQCAVRTSPSMHIIHGLFTSVCGGGGWGGG